MEFEEVSLCQMWRWESLYNVYSTSAIPKLIWSIIVFLTLALADSVNKPEHPLSIPSIKPRENCFVRSPSESDTQIFLLKAVAVDMIHRPTCSRQSIMEH